MSTNVEIKQGGGWSFLLLALLLVAGVALYLVAGELSVSKKNEALMAGNYVAMQDSFKSYQVWVNDTVKVLVVEKQQVTVERDDFKRLHKDDVKTMKKMGTHINDLQGQMAISIIAIDTVPGDTTYIDTLRNIHAEYKSRWIDISCKINRLLNESSFAYETRTEINATKEIKRGHFLFFTWKKEKSATWKVWSSDTTQHITKFNYTEVIK